MTTVINPDQETINRRDALAERLFNASVEGWTRIRLPWRPAGYYRALVELGEATSASLATHLGVNERYTREWLEQQAITGILDVDDTGDATSRRYTLPDGHATALLDDDSLAYSLPMVRMMTGVFRILPALADAYRNGGGVAFADFGEEDRDGIGAMTASCSTSSSLASGSPRCRISTPASSTRGVRPAWRTLGAVPAGPASRWRRGSRRSTSRASTLTRLRSRTPSPRCGVGVSDRVGFHHGDASDPELAGRFDLACAFECLHDMARPVDALRAMRQLVGPGGTVLIADERVADEFGAIGDFTERFMYGFSVLHCLTVAMADGAEEGTGTVFRTRHAPRLRQRGRLPGRPVLPIENDFWRFYRLTA